VIRLALAVAVALAAAACNPYLTAQSLPPPGRAGSLEPVDGFWSVNYYKLEVSAGTALALTCSRGGPCRGLHAVSRDPAVATVVPAALARLDASAWAANRPMASFVVVGKRAGTTTIDVTAKEGKRRIEVTVLAPPSPAPVMAADAQQVTP
jgi:hypothetical protein